MTNPFATPWERHDDGERIDDHHPLKHRVDAVTMQAMDMLLAFPSLMLGPMLVAMLGPSILNIIAAIDMGVVAEIADRVVAMWKGKKAEEGSAAETLTRPRHSYTQALIAAAPRHGSMKGEPSPKPYLEPEIAVVVPDPNRGSNTREVLAFHSDHGPPRSRGCGGRAVA